MNRVLVYNALDLPVRQVHKRRLLRMASGRESSI